MQASSLWVATCRLAVSSLDILWVFSRGMTNQFAPSYGKPSVALCDAA